MTSGVNVLPLLGLSTFTFPGVRGVTPSFFSSRSAWALRRASCLILRADFTGSASRRTWHVPKLNYLKHVNTAHWPTSKTRSYLVHSPLEEKKTELEEHHFGSLPSGPQRNQTHLCQRSCKVAARGAAHPLACYELHGCLPWLKCKPKKHQPKAKKLNFQPNRIGLILPNKKLLTFKFRCTM